MSGPESDNQSEACKPKNNREDHKKEHLAALVVGLLCTFINIGRPISKENAEHQEQRADEHLIATATEKMARYTKLLFVVTILSVVTAGATAWILWNQLTEMRNEQRPWIYAEPYTGGPIIGNLSEGFAIQIGFRFQNIGHSPAFYVMPDVEGYLSGEPNPVGGVIAREIQKTRCDREFRQPVANSGTTVFPGQKADQGLGYVFIQKPKIEMFRRSWKEKTGKEPEVMMPWIVGCVRYQSADGRPHQTGVALTVVTTKQGEQGWVRLPVDPSHVDPRNIFMVPWVMDGTAYAN